MKRGASSTISSAILFVFLAVSAFLAVSCGQPNIAIDGQVVHPAPTEPYVPATYTLGAGDVLEVLYHSDPTENVEEYFIGLGDQLDVFFFNHQDLNQTALKVRPDGRISLPLIGEMRVVGRTPDEVSKELQDVYTSQLRNVKVTVMVREFNVRLEELREAVTTTTRGQARIVTVRPDGAITLPYIGDVQVLGLTMPELNKKVDESYKALVSGIGVTLDLNEAKSNLIYVMGEVNRANFFQLLGPTTVTQAVAMAGGFTNNAYTQEVVLISRNEKNEPTGTIVDMNEVIGKGNIGADAMLKQYDVVYVPSSPMSQAGLFGSQLWSLIPVSFVGSAGYSYGYALQKTID